MSDASLGRLFPSDALLGHAVPACLNIIPSLYI
jgi:hypothetical protein